MEQKESKKMLYRTFSLRTSILVFCKNTDFFVKTARQIKGITMKSLMSTEQKRNIKMFKKKYYYYNYYNSYFLMALN